MNTFKRWLLGLVVILGGCTTNSTSEDASSVIRYNSIHHPVISDGGMVVSQSSLATEVGADILRKGGNAVDATVATGFALAVTLPRAGNIGGGGFSLVHISETNETLAFDFRGVAPASFTADPYRNEKGHVDRSLITYGPASAAVPGTVAGFYEIWQRYGSLEWAELVRPAIELAASGIVVTDDLAFVLENSSPTFHDHKSSGEVFLRPDTSNFSSGDRLKQSDLAWSLEQIAKHGAESFYGGELGARIAKGITEAGGYITEQDLANYKTKQRNIISTNYRGHQVFTMPPPSSGGLALLQMLNMLSHYDLSEFPAGSADQLHLLAEVMKRGAANRRGQVADPDFFDVPVKAFLDKELAIELASEINLNKAQPTSEMQPTDFVMHEKELESRDTSHFSVMDDQGNAVSTTYTLGYSFGSGFVVPGTGILLDNQMRNFAHNNPKHPNIVEPGKRMGSSMTPAIVLDETGEVSLVTGSPGGSRIINVVLQLLVNHLDYGMNIAEATARPRIHQSWPDEALYLEPGFSVDTEALLLSRGHKIKAQKTMGSTQSISIGGDLIFGAADSRRPGAVAISVAVNPPKE